MTPGRVRRLVADVVVSALRDAALVGLLVGLLAAVLAGWREARSA